MGRNYAGQYVCGDNFFGRILVAIHREGNALGHECAVNIGLKVAQYFGVSLTQPIVKARPSSARITSAVKHFVIRRTELIIFKRTSLLGLGIILKSR